MKYEKIISESLAGLHGAMITKANKMDSRIQQIETKFDYNVLTGSLGERIVKGASDFLAKKTEAGRLHLTQAEIKTAIIGDHTQNNPLGDTSRPMIAEGPRRRLFMRDLLTPATTTEAAVEFPIESTFTNNSGPQVGNSPEQYENVNLGESGFTFNLSFQPCITLGHFIHTSAQVLQDSAVLDAFLKNRMFYGLRVNEDNQILNGTGANGELSGLLKAGNFTAYNRAGGSPDTDTPRERIGRALTQVELADYSPSGIVINPVDWETIKLALKTEPKDYSLFGVPVAVTNAIASGSFLTGDFARAAVLFDRKAPDFQYSYHNDINYQKNLVTLKIDERASLVVSNPAALVSGSF